MDMNNSSLMDWIRDFQLENFILLLGPRNDIPGIMNTLDIHVLSSTYGEAFPNVLAEAMACGTPCVTTNVGDAAIIVGNSGWVASANDSAGLATALLNACNEWENPSKWSERCRNSRLQFSNNFSLSKMIKQYHSTWDGKN
jgi:glycosyltransferase involved in cell wall biosynthesis